MTKFIVEVEHEPLTPEQLEEIKAKAADDLFDDLFADPQKLKWGTYGPKGDRLAAQVRPFVELDTDHLENILITQPQLPPYEAAAILFILKTRYLAEVNKSRPWPA